MNQAFARQWVDAAAAPYGPARRFGYQFARGKLAGDPVFRSLLERGLVPDGARILDLGCGQGLLAAWLLAARRLFEAGAWPVGWPDAPQPAAYRGVELMADDVRRARRALGGLCEFAQGDIRAVDFGQADVAVILDVLHYFDHAAQFDVLSRARDALAPSGLLLLRVGDAGGGLPFLFSNWVDRVVTLARGHRLSRLHCRSLGDWLGVLAGLGFAVESLPMSQGTPFGNVLLVARLGAEPVSCESPLTTAGFPL
jgi:SAM-dependent methyltransferase